MEKQDFESRTRKTSAEAQSARLLEETLPEYGTWPCVTDTVISQTFPVLQTTSFGKITKSAQCLLFSPLIRL